MKNLFVGLIVLTLSVVWTLGAEQKFSSLPIGYNLDEYIHSVRVTIWTSGNSIKDEFQYNRRYDGFLESFAAQKLRELANRYVPQKGQETAPHAWSMDAITDGIGGLLPTYNGESKPTTIAFAPPAGESSWFYSNLRNGKWEVPEEVFGKVKFQFGAAPGFYIPGAADLEVNLYSGSRISRFSTRERTSDSDNSCVLPATLDAIKYEGVIVIPNEIATAQPAWWERAEITLLTEDGASVTFFVNRTAEDGKAIRWSNPPPSFFTPPPPKIASLTRVGDRTELVVERSSAMSLEFSENLREWSEVAGSRITLASENASVTISHKITVSNGFYRLRLKDEAQ